MSEAHRLCVNALQAHGASREQAESVAKSLVKAELQGKPDLGISHLFDYLNALREGRVDGCAEPCVTRTTQVLFMVDSCGGFPHTGVDGVFSEFVDAAQTQGIAALGLKNGYTCGELGYLPRRLAEHGLLGLAAANGGPQGIYHFLPMGYAARTSPSRLSQPRQQRVVQTGLRQIYYGNTDVVLCQIR